MPLTMKPDKRSFSESVLIALKLDIVRHEAYNKGNILHKNSKYKDKWGLY